MIFFRVCVFINRRRSEVSCIRNVYHTNTPKHIYIVPRITSTSKYPNRFSTCQWILTIIINFNSNISERQLLAIQRPAIQSWLCRPRFPAPCWLLVVRLPCLRVSGSFFAHVFNIRYVTFFVYVISATFLYVQEFLFCFYSCMSSHFFPYINKEKSNALLSFCP